MVMEIYEETRKRFEIDLERFTNNPSTINNSITRMRHKLFDSIHYSLFSGGKRLRPVIGIQTFKMFSDDYDVYIPYAIAVELIHTYSLIHDDLPAMDNDDYRRGKPTNHIKFGEDMAILAGDALLNLAFETMLNRISDSRLTVEDYKKANLAMYNIATYSGHFGMIGGQVADIFSEEEDIDEDLLKYMYQTKTAGLFKAAIVSAAIVGNGSSKEIEILTKFGNNLGLSYQIQDDLLDKEEDEKNGKITYVTFFGEEKARKDMNIYVNEAISLLKSLEDRDTKFLEDITLKLVNREK